MLAAAKGADQGDRLARTRQGEKFAVILEHDDRLAPGFARERPGFRKHRTGAFALHVDASERIIKEAEHRLQCEHSADRLIEERFGYLAAAHEIRQMPTVKAALH